MFRSYETYELLRDPLAFALLTLIALRARWQGESRIDRLQLGEALIGDHKECGLTRREYRTRLNRLKKSGYIKARSTRKGTIARLLLNSVFDVNERRND